MTDIENLARTKRNLQKALITLYLIILRNKKRIDENQPCELISSTPIAYLPIEALTG